MRPYRFALCDDEALYRDQLIKLLEDYAIRNSMTFVIDSFENGNWLVDQAMIDFDIIFLDIEMGLMNGIDVAKDLKAKFPDVIIVFITNHDGYAIQAFEIRAFHYLKKPVTAPKLNDILTLAFKELREEEEQAFFVVKANTNVYKIPTKNILYFEKQRNKTLVVTLNEAYETYETMKSLLSILDPAQFLACHQGYIIAMSKVDRIEQNTIKMINGQIIPISKANVKEIKQHYMSYLCGERMK